MIGALKEKYILPKDFLETSAELEEIITDEFYGERLCHIKNPDDMAIPGEEIVQWLEEIPQPHG